MLTAQKRVNYVADIIAGWAPWSDDPLAEADEINDDDGWSFDEYTGPDGRRWTRYEGVRLTTEELAEAARLAQTYA